MNSESLGENVEFWDVWALRGYDDGMLNENYQSMSRRIAADVGPVDYALDVATGTGLAAFELAKNVGKVEAIDFASEMINVAQRKVRELGLSNIRFHVQSAYKLAFPNHVFDAVVIANALHSMLRPEQALAEARRVLKPHGLIIVPTPCHGENHETLIQVHKIMGSGFKDYKGITELGFRDYQLFSGDRLAKLVRKCGFAVTERDKLEWVFRETGFRMLVEYVVAKLA
jgi:ubiquinone/menaquinone biosynthesis C-methylase UbiE